MHKNPAVNVPRRLHNAAEKEPGMHVPVSAVFRRPPVTVGPDTSLRVALQTMEQMRIGSIIVVEPGSEIPLGIFTLQDVLRRVALPQPDLEIPISHVMSADPVSLNIRATVHQVALLMARRNLRHVLITDDTHRLQGIISKNDLYDIMCTSCAAVRDARRKTADATANKCSTCQL